jgi:hypothetical protein
LIQVEFGLVAILWMIDFQEMVDKDGTLLSEVLGRRYERSRT